MNTQKHLYDIVKDFQTAMLVTRAGQDLHARPMAIAELKPDADAYFMTRIEAPKVAEVTADPNVLLTFQSSSEYASMRGTVSVVRDRALIDRLWSDTWKVWFPKGKDDPALCVLKFTGRDAEYWDNSGLEGLKYVFEGVKALFKGRTPEIDQSIHAKVKL